MKSALDEIVYQWNYPNCFDTIKAIYKKTIKKSQDHRPCLNDIYEAMRHGEGIIALAYIAVYKTWYKDSAVFNFYNHEYTLLGYAAKISNIDIVYTLLKFGADPNLKSQDGKSPLWYATDEHVINVLKKYGGKVIGPTRKIPKPVKIDYKFDVWERMSLAAFLTYYTHDRVDLDGDEAFGNALAHAWFVIDWYIKSGRPFNLMSIQIAYENSELVHPWIEEENGKERLMPDKEFLSGYKEYVKLEEKDWEVFKHLSYDFFRVPAAVTWSHTQDEKGYLVKDLVFNGPVYLVFEDVDIDFPGNPGPQRFGWGYIQYYGGGL